jgi:endo-1,4-beta-D-glucanase Y
MKKIIMTCSLLLSAVFSSHATTYPTDASSSKYYGYYQAYRNTGNFWVNVSKMGSVSVASGNSTGLGILNTDYYGNTNRIVSETMGYAMIVAALYNDKVTFDRLSATVQAGMQYGKVDWINTPTKLLPWNFAVTSAGNYTMAEGSSSASDADINIALAYIYADKASIVYNWSTMPTGGNSTYAQMATSAVQAIRKWDFAASNSYTANRYILTMGSDQGAAGKIDVWFPDYSDIRAYQLFSTYDPSSFWQTAISYTKESWKAIYDFGDGDNRTTLTSQPSTNDDIQANTYNALLANEKFTNVIFSSSYANVNAIRTWYTYATDSCRMPIRLMNYVYAAENSDGNMSGIANSILTGLGSTYLSYSSNITNSINIWTPFSQGGDYVQDYIAAGLLALSADTNLTYSGRATVETNLLTQFGNGTNGTISGNLSSSPPDGFNDSLTIWGLTVSAGGNTPLQEYIEGLKSGIGTTTNSASSSPTTPASITSGSTVAEVKAIVSSRIQTALAAPGSAPKRSLTDTATILGVSKSNLSKALNLAPTGVKASNGKVNLSKFSKFISRNSKAATLLAGKSKAKGKKTSAK